VLNIVVQFLEVWFAWAWYLGIHLVCHIVDAQPVIASFHAADFVIGLSRGALIKRLSGL
jgi:hypothetical protein